MSFSFSFSSSSTFVSTTSTNGHVTGQAYQRQSYSTPQGSGVRTTHQTLGGKPITTTRMYDAYGRELIGNGSYAPPTHQNQGSRVHAPGTRILSIEDVTEEEDKKAAQQSRKQKFHKG